MMNRIKSRSLNTRSKSSYLGALGVLAVKKIMSILLILSKKRLVAA